MNPNLLSDMLTFLNSSEHRIHSILIVKNGYLVFEKYFSGYMYNSSPPGSDGPYITYHRDTLHFLASVSKSVASVLFGIAIGRNDHQSLQNRVINYFPQYASILTGNKSEMTIEHFLTMTPGLTWDEYSYPYGDPRNDVTQLFIQSDPIRFVLEKPLNWLPGDHFHYNSGSTNVIAELTRLISQQSSWSFAEDSLFTPLGIHHYYWEEMGGDRIFASGGLYLSPRSLSKIGYLFLKGGQWRGEQIISQAWIDASVARHVIHTGNWEATGYGYQWWLCRYLSAGRYFDGYFAAGWGGQYMFVFPQEDLIVVFNGGYFLTPMTVPPVELLITYILPSLLV
jgi:CubicO group peptidase (beta-lactamase class C family)